MLWNRISGVILPTKYKILAVVAPLVFILDQVTKWFIRARLGAGQNITIIPGYFDIVHVANKGAAFGLFSGSSSSFRVPFFYLVSFMAVVIIIVMFVKLAADDRLMALIFSLILAGIAGNILDRIRFGEVTDFLSVHLHDLEWPAFNVADSAITVAMILLVWGLIVFRKA